MSNFIKTILAALFLIAISFSASTVFISGNYDFNSTTNFEGYTPAMQNGTNTNILINSTDVGDVFNITVYYADSTFTSKSFTLAVNGTTLVNSSSINVTDVAYIVSARYSTSATGTISLMASNGSTIFRISPGSNAPNTATSVCARPQGCDITQLMYSTDGLTKFYVTVGGASAGPTRTLWIWANSPGTNNIFLPSLHLYAGQTIQFSLTPIFDQAKYVESGNNIAAMPDTFASLYYKFN